MSPEPSRHHADGPLTRLLKRELAMLVPILDGVFGVWGLHIRPHAQAPAILPAHLLGTMLDVSVGPDGMLAGAIRCRPDELPFANESFKLVVVQHVFEQTGPAEDAAAEVARVLAPEGIALVFGFNPASLWRPWLSRRFPGRLRFRAAGGWREVLGRSRLDVLQVRYSGLWSPWAAGSDAPAPRSLGRFGGSWLLLARKRRDSLTPLRLAAVRSDLKLKPSLVPGARRECA